MDLERKVYQVCTQRPAKSSKKLARLNSFERRTLSFDETPKRTPLIQKHKSDSFLGNLTLSQTSHELVVVDPVTCYSEKIAFQDRSNIIDINRPSTSKGIHRNSTNAIENMCLMSDNCTNVVTDFEFFSDNLWPDMPEMLSPKHLKMYPRKV